MNLSSSKKIVLFSILLGLFLFTSCEQAERKGTIQYPIDSLVVAQSLYLADAGAKLTKHAEINGDEETSEFIPKDTTTWQHELEIFSELKAINKPIHASAYKVERGLKDTNSNLTITSFTSLEKLPVAHLKVFYLDSPSRLRRIEAFFQEDNLLVNGSRFLVMEFEEIENKIVLISYSIEGGQKMFLSDPVQFLVRGTITLPN